MSSDPRRRAAEALAEALLAAFDVLLAAREPAAPPSTPPAVSGLDELPLLVPLWPEAARLLGCSRNRAYELARAGVIATLRLGKRTFVRRADLERLLTGDAAAAPAMVPLPPRGRGDAA